MQVPPVHYKYYEDDLQANLRSEVNPFPLHSEWVDRDIKVGDNIDEAVSQAFFCFRPHPSIWVRCLLLTLNHVHWVDRDIKVGDLIDEAASECWNGVFSFSVCGYVVRLLACSHAQWVGKGIRIGEVEFYSAGPAVHRCLECRCTVLSQRNPVSSVGRCRLLSLLILFEQIRVRVFVGSSMRFVLSLLASGTPTYAKLLTKCFCSNRLRKAGVCVRV